jgi:hypothetical protein
VPVGPRTFEEHRQLIGGTVRTRSDPDHRRTGRFLGIPYDWRRPTLARLQERWWNVDDRRVFTPKAFGWGYDMNLAGLLRRLGLLRRR